MWGCFGEGRVWKRRRSIAKVEGVGEALKKHGDEKCWRQIVVTSVSQTSWGEKCSESVEVEKASRRTIVDEWKSGRREQCCGGEVGNVLGEVLENGAYQRFEAATIGLEVERVLKNGGREVLRCGHKTLGFRSFWKLAHWVRASQGEVAWFLS